MVSVGGLAAIVNVAILLVVTITDRAIELIVRNFAAARLRNSRRAPIVHDSDTWLPNVPRSLIKYRRNPAILLTILSTVLLIASETVSEIGVEVSQHCRPVKMTGRVIGKGDISGRVTTVEKGAGAFFLQNLTFAEGPLTRVPAGLPRRLTGRECISCMDDDREKYPDVISNCQVTVTREYAPNELKIGVVSSTTSPFGNIVHGFMENDGTEYIGPGDITNNGDFWSSFVVSAVASEIIYIEYDHQEHVADLLRRGMLRQDEVIWDSIRASVEKLTVTCAVNLINIENFEPAMQIYRTIQLENPVNPAVFNNDTQRFARLSDQDVYKAALSIKVIDDEHTVGEFYSFTTCGVYNWLFFVPMAVCVVFVILLGVTSIFSSSVDVLNRIPYNSLTWFRHAQMVDGEVIGKDCEPHGFRERYTAGMKDEMVILEFDEEAGSDRPRIALRSRCYASGSNNTIQGLYNPTQPAVQGTNDWTEEMFN